MGTLTIVAGGALAVVVLVTFSAFFSSSESAIFSLPEQFIHTRTESGDVRAAILHELREDPHRLLVTLLVGNNIVNIAISSIITVIVVSYFPPGIAVTIATLLASAIVLVFGEIVPKSYGLGNAEEWSLTVARPITVVERALYPVVVVFDAVTRRLNALIGGDRDIEKQYLEDESLEERA